jgi:2-methylisocitrate lyase-like PEP mutase family enzyme
MKKTTMLRKLLEKPGFVSLPVVYDAMSARIAETVGFKALFMAVSATSDAQLGLPGLGLATSTEIIYFAKCIANAVNVPLIVNVDDGFGGALGAFRTTEELIRAGAAAIYLSDRKPVIPARVPHNMLEVLPRAEYLGKMGAIVEARNGLDKDFLIFARIDAGALNGDDEVVARAKALVKMGVDVIVPHQRPPESKYGIRTKETLRTLYKKIGAPKVWIWGMGPLGTTIEDYVEVGAKLCMPDASSSAAVKDALFNDYQYLYDNGPANARETPGSREISDKIRGHKFWHELEDKYVP